MNIITNKAVIDGIVACLGYSSHGAAPFYTAAREGLPQPFLMLGSSSYGTSLYSLNEVESYLKKKGFTDGEVEKCVEDSGARSY